MLFLTTTISLQIRIHCTVYRVIHGLKSSLSLHPLLNTPTAKHAHIPQSVFVFWSSSWWKLMLQWLHVVAATAFNNRNKMKKYKVTPPTCKQTSNMHILCSSVCVGNQQRSCINVARLVSSIWYGWPRYISAKPEDIIRYRWQCTGVVHIVSQRLHPVSPLRPVYFQRLGCLVWGAAGISPRTDTVPVLHSRPTAAWWVPQPAATHVRRQYADLWFCHPAAATQLQEQVSACIDNVATWMQSTGSSWTLQRPKLFGADRIDGSITY